MKRDYIALWSILAAAFVLFFSLSMCDVNIGHYSVRKSKLSSSLLVDSTAVSSQDASDVPLQVEKAASSAGSAPLVPDDAKAGAGTSKPSSVMITPSDSSKNVLIIGDSMLEGLAPRLAAYCSASGYDLYTVIWYSSTTELYGKTALLSDYIRLIDPAYIFLSLGGNELFVSDVAEKRDRYVKSILNEIGTIPFLWIGPPNWKPDTGINSLLRSDLPEGCFFLSDGMSFKRKRDGAHPTSESAAVWMDSIVRWMPDHARYFIKFDDPVQKSSRSKRMFIHQPGDLSQRPL